MQESNNSNALHWILGAALLLIGLFVVVALVNVKSQADSVTTSVAVTNVAPVIGQWDLHINTVSAASTADESSITPTAGTTKTVYINGTVQDSNGDGDITSVNMAFGKTTQTCTTTTGSADDNDCYKQTGCTLSNNTGGDESATFACALSLNYYADATDTGAADAATTWTATVLATDNGTLTGSRTRTTEINTLLALTIPATIDYGTLTRTVSTTNTNNQEMTIIQQGNDVADVQVSSAAAMTCTQTGSIPVASQHWSLTDVSYAAGTALTGSAADTDLAVQLRTGASTTKILYWNILMPDSVAGTCTGTTTITAYAA